MYSVPSLNMQYININDFFCIIFFPLFFFHLLPCTWSGGGRKTCVQKKWPIHQTPSHHLLISIQVHSFMYKNQDTIVNTKRTKLAQGIFLTHKITHISHPSLALKTHPVIHINNKKDNQLRDNFKPQPPVDRRFRPVPAGFYCQGFLQWEPDGTTGRPPVGF